MEQQLSQSQFMPLPMEQPHDEFGGDEPYSVIEGDSIITRFPDGSTAYVPYVPDNQNSNRHHKENLALILSETELAKIGSSLKYAIEEDIQSQKPFQEAVAYCMKLMGLDLRSKVSENLPFDGASGVYSSKMFEVAQTILADVRGIYKSAGIADVYTLGEQTYDLEDSSSKMKDWANYYIDYVAKEFKPDSEQQAFLTILAGYTYCKAFISPTLNRVVCESIDIEDFIVNAIYSSHLTAPRRTHILRLSQKEFITRIHMGIYRDIRISKEEDGGFDTEDVIREQANRQTGADPRGIPEDGVYVNYESHADCNIDGDDMVPDDGIPSPYRITLDRQSGKLLGLYRNWKEGDPERKRIEYFGCEKFLTALQGPGYGLAHYAPKLAAAATSLARQGVNTGMLASFPGGFCKQGMRFDNNNISFDPGEFKPVMGALDKLADNFFTPPFRDPSPLLNEFRKDFEDSIAKPAAIADQKVSDLPVNASTQTVLAIFEELHKLPNVVMQNFYESLKVKLGLIKDRFEEWLGDNTYRFKIAGAERTITKADFKEGIILVPSADPSAKSTAHKLILAGTILDNAKAAPDIYNQKYAHELYLKDLQVSQKDIDKLLNPPKDETPPPQPMDPVSTMMALIKGEPVTAAVWQEHDAYIAILNAWIQMNPQDPHLQNAMALKTQYEAYKYMVDAYAALGMQPPQDPSQLSPEQQNQIAVQLAYVKMQEMQEAQAQAAQQQGSTPMDLAAVELESAKMQTQIQHEKNEIELRKVEVDEKKIEMDYQLKVQEFDLKMRIQHLQEERESFKIAHEQAIKERDQALKEKEAAIDEMQRQVEEAQQQEQLTEGMHQ
jgi:hypothetical protein